MSVLVGEKIEGDKLRRYFSGQLPYPRCCRVQPKLQRVEGVARYHQLSVEHEPRRFDGSGCLGDFWKIPFERFLTARLEMNLIPVPEDDAPEAIDFWFVLPSFACRWQRIDGFGLHGLERQGNLQVHARQSPPEAEECASPPTPHKPQQWKSGRD
jgi:hypothetical protein